jgi:hypothetical protein
MFLLKHYIVKRRRYAAGCLVTTLYTRYQANSGSLYKPLYIFLKTAFKRRMSAYQNYSCLSFYSLMYCIYAHIWLILLNMYCKCCINAYSNGCTFCCTLYILLYKKTPSFHPGHPLFNLNSTAMCVCNKVRFKTVKI